MSRDEVLPLVAKTGDVDRISRFLDHYKDADNGRFMEHVLLSGNLDAIRVCRKRGLGWPAGSFSHLARATKNDDSFLYEAIEDGCKLDPTCEYIEKTGDLECLKRIHQTFNIPLSKELTCAYAIACNNMEMLSWAISRDCVKNEQACKMAAWKGDITLLHWLRQNEFPWDDQTCNWAANAGHLEALKWARANGCPWNGYVYYHAAVNGHLEVIKWARANGCPWDNNWCLDAILNDQEDVVTWMIMHGGAHVTRDMIRTAIKRQNLNILELVVKNKPSRMKTFSIGFVLPWCMRSCRALTLMLDNFDWYDKTFLFSMVIRDGTLACVKLLYDRGFKWEDRSVVVAAEYGKVHMLKWLKEKGCAIGRDITYVGIQNNQRFVIEWGLKCDNPVIPDESFFEEALQNFRCNATGSSIAFVFKILIENGLRLTPACSRMIVERHKSSSFLPFVWNMGCPVDHSFIKLIKGNPRNVEYASVYEMHGSKVPIEIVDDE